MWESGEEIRRNDAKRLLELVIEGTKKFKCLSSETLPFLAAITVLFMIGWIVIANIHPPSLQCQIQPPNRAQVRIYYSFAILILSIAFIIDVMGWMYTVNPLKMRLCSVMCFIKLITAFTYFILLLDMGPNWTSFACREVRPCMYVEWMATSPALIFLCSQLGSMSKSKVFGIICCDLLMLIFGLAATVTLLYPWNWILLCFSWLFAAPTFCGIYMLLTQAIQKALRPDIRSLKTLRNVTLLVWIAFPVVWHCAIANAISQTTEALLFTAVDVNAKAVHTAILLGQNFFSIDQLEALTNLSRKKDHRFGKGSQEVTTALLQMSKAEVHRTTQLQGAFLFGVLCSGLLLLLAFYLQGMRH